MPVSAGLAAATLAATRSPVSLSTEASRRSSFRPAGLSVRDSEPRASSPPGRLTRKRAATLSTERSNLSQSIGDLAIAAASATALPQSDLIREQVCLCQPDPKIPRPRNAFILYRQHYQAQVIAQNPGLANPEISKIIGEQWRDQAPEVKNDWKRLAEEEKQRHRRQYPGYRYQPRRAGKTAAVRQAADSPFSDSPGRCPKCSGRYIFTPSTPSTPLTHSFEAGTSPHKEQHSRIRPIAAPRGPLSQQSNTMSQMQSNGNGSPQTSAFHQQSPRHAPHPQTQAVSAYNGKDDELEILLSPSTDHKRRRYNPESQLKGGYPSPTAISFPPSQPYSRSGLGISNSSYRAQPYPGSSMTAQQSPISQNPHQSYASTSSGFTETLHLPPLQTQFSNSSSYQTMPPKSDSSTSTSSSTAHSNNARNVETSIISIPYINKIKVLSKISPPLTMRPGVDVRGAVIAVEGPDQALVAEIGDIIHEHLMRDASCAVKTWSIPEVDRGEGDVDMGGVRSGSGSGSGMEMGMIDPQITESSSSSSSSPSNANTSTTTTSATTTTTTTTKTSDSFLSYLSIITSWHKLSPDIIQYITTPPSSSPSLSPSQSPSSQLTPIALLPYGFSLSTSDIHARLIPLTDAYAPVDHWQWMATLWRGIVGPDLTIYVKGVDGDEGGAGVEVRADCRVIVVRVGKGGKEGLVRRLGFEVGEFVRGGMGRG